MKSMLGFDLRKSLGKITVPTLVLAGSGDRNAPAPMMRKMAGFIPNAEYVEFEGVGHLVALERPKIFDAALDRFLKANVATQATAT
jgi:3-oxoadipate enol-lactonase